MHYEKTTEANLHLATYIRNSAQKNAYPVILFYVKGLSVSEQMFSFDYLAVANFVPKLFFFIISMLQIAPVIQPNLIILFGKKTIILPYFLHILHYFLSLQNACLAYSQNKRQLL